MNVRTRGVIHLKADPRRTVVGADQLAVNADPVTQTVRVHHQAPHRRRRRGDMDRGGDDAHRREKRYRSCSVRRQRLARLPLGERVLDSRVEAVQIHREHPRGVLADAQQITP